MRLAQLLAHVLEPGFFGGLFVADVGNVILPLIGHHGLLGLLDFQLQLIEPLFHPSGRLAGGIVFRLKIALYIVFDQGVNDGSGLARVGALKADERHAGVLGPFHLEVALKCGNRGILLCRRNT